MKGVISYVGKKVHKETFFQAHDNFKNVILLFIHCAGLPLCTRKYFRKIRALAIGNLGNTIVLMIKFRHIFSHFYLFVLMWAGR